MVLLQLTSPPSLLPHWEALGPEGGILSLCPLPHGLSMGNVPQQKSQFNSTHILSLHYCQLVVLFLNKPMLTYTVYSEERFLINSKYLLALSCTRDQLGVNHYC